MREGREGGRVGMKSPPDARCVPARTEGYRVVVEALDGPLQRGRGVESGSGGGGRGCWWRGGWGAGIETDNAGRTALRDSARARIYDNASGVVSFVSHARACPGCGRVRGRPGWSQTRGG